MSTNYHLFGFCLSCAFSVFLWALVSINCLFCALSVFLWALVSKNSHLKLICCVSVFSVLFLSSCGPWCQLHRQGTPNSVKRNRWNMASRGRKEGAHRWKHKYERRHTRAQMWECTDESSRCGSIKVVVVKVALTVVVEPTTSKTASSLKFKTLQEHLHIEIHEHKWEHTYESIWEHIWEHTSESTNVRAHTSTNLRAHRRVHRSISKFTMYRACHEICASRFTKYCACHEICTSRFTKYCACHEICTSSFTKCCACHEICASRFTKYCACHKICTSSFTKCCACHEICASRFTKCCACHEICASRFTKCCACHAICASRFTKCCACHELCASRFTKCCACHAICASRFTKCCACHEICASRFTKCCACHEICTSRFTKCCACHAICTSRFTKCGACHEICASRFTKCCACHELCASEIQNEQIARGFRKFWNAFQKCCACHEIMPAGRTKCCTGHAKSSSRPKSKNATPLTNSAVSPQNIASMVRISCACHVKRSPANDARLPTFLQRPQNTAPATKFAKSPIPCTCHVKWPFRGSNVSNSLRLPREIHFRSENEHGACARALSRKRENRDPHCMRACAVEMDTRNSKSNFCASRPTQNAGATRANPNLNPLNSYRKNPLVRSTIWGKSLILRWFALFLSLLCSFCLLVGLGVK